MGARESVREGRLDEALAEVQALVRKEPGSAAHRVSLFQLLAVLGQWDRALTQLETAGQLDAAHMPLVHVYRAALAAEATRAAVFAGTATPSIIGEPLEWMAWLVEALRLTARGEHEEAAALRGRALDAAPATPCEVDGTEVAWIADADPRLGPMLEVIVNGKYGWLPLQRLAAMRLQPPADLRDVVWMPVSLTLEGGAEVGALVPARYVGSEAAADPGIRLGRRTEWRELGPGCAVGLGQRMLATDRDDHPLMDLRAVRFPGAGGRARAEGASGGVDG